jgi:5'-3' exonuclease
MRWLVLDCNYLCWRAWHTTGQLSYRGKGTGVVYGFLREVLTLQELHATDRFVFCFDHGRAKSLLRRAIYPTYKLNREEKDFTKEQEQEFNEVRRQMSDLRKLILPGLGFKNIFCEKGFEADDLIASVVLNLKRDDQAIIVGADKDLYQLLSQDVFIWNPTTGVAVTQNSFSKKYGVTPTQWVDVKAMAGCTSDNVCGIKGVGEITACKFLNGKLFEGRAFQLIVKGNKIWKRNKLVVKLPYPGTPKFKLRKDKVGQDKWRELAQRLGFRSFTNAIDGGSMRYVKTQTQTKNKRQRKGFFV